MKKKRGFGRGCLLLLALAGLLLSGCHAREKAAQESDLYLSVDYGYQKYTRSGRYMRVAAELGNSGEAFSGAFSVLVKQENETGILYQKEVLLKAGESKQITMAVPVDSTASEYSFALMDERENILVQREGKAYLVEGETLFTGILTESRQELAALSGEQLRSFYLEAEAFPEEARELDALDLLLLHDFDTDTLEEAQKRAIKEFVRQGGTLVLYAGGREAKLLEEFDLSGEAASEEADALLTGRQLGQGKILITSVSLAEAARKQELAEELADNISSFQKEKIRQEVQGSDYSYLRHLVADMAEADRIPSVGKYAVILLLYLLLIGPPLYLVLKRLDRRNLAWILIPAFSVLFGSFLYGIGGKTRLEQPYIGFMSVSVMENGMESQNTLFSMAAPYNNDYTVSFPGNQPIVPEEGANNYYTGNTQTEAYTIAMKYKEAETEIKIQNRRAFETVYFETSRLAKARGEVGSTLDFTGSRISGELVNELGFDLEQAALYVCGRLYLLGELKQGEAVSIGEQPMYLLLSRRDIYSDELLNQLSGGNPYGSQGEQTAEQARWYYAYEYGLTRLIEGEPSGCYLLGFPQSSENPFLQESGLQLKGVNLVMAAAEVNLTREGQTWIPRLEAYIQSVEGDYDAIYHMIYSEELRMLLQLDKEASITELCYTKEMNPEFDPESLEENGFYGKIKAYNYRTGTYDVVFESGRAGRVPAADYLDENNRLQLLLEPDATRLLRCGGISMPVLSAIKEEK